MINNDTKVIFRTTEINTGRIKETEVTLYDALAKKPKAFEWAQTHLTSKDFEIVPKNMLNREDARRYYVELKLLN